jgi:transposase InsO family protein/transposase-like protein
MTPLAQREAIVRLVDEAIEQGARISAACPIAGISVRTLQRWRPQGLTEVTADQRQLAKRAPPVNQLTEAEREQIVAVCNRPEYASLPPSQIVPKLADTGEYIASESTFYRVLKIHRQVNRRGYAKAPQAPRTPVTHCATAPNQVWTWDVTWLPSTITGRFFYLYMVEDLFSRYGVAWEVHENESGEQAAELLEKAVWREKLTGSNKPVLHNDNGSIMKSQTFRAKLDELGISQSFSRPRVSDDNAYVESFFRTLKYAPAWPVKGFETLEEAREWVQRFMQWYNHQHQHSKIRFVTPAQRHHGEEKLILARRNTVYAAAKAKHPERWSGKTRNWNPIGAVTLNPDKQERDKREIAA